MTTYHLLRSFSVSRSPSRIQNTNTGNRDKHVFMVTAANHHSTPKAFVISNGARKTRARTKGQVPQKTSAIPRDRSRTRVGAQNIINLISPSPSKFSKSAFGVAGIGLCSSRLGADPKGAETDFVHPKTDFGYLLGPGKDKKIQIN